MPLHYWQVDKDKFWLGVKFFFFLGGNVGVKKNQLHFKRHDLEGIAYSACTIPPLQHYSLICLRQRRGRKLCWKDSTETQRHLHNTNFGALNILLQKEHLIRALNTPLIEEGERNREKILSLLRLKSNAMSGHSFFP